MDSIASSSAPDAAFASLQEENRQLKLRIQQLELAAAGASQSSVAATVPSVAHPSIASTAAAAATASSPWSHGLSATQIERYSRQLLLSELGGADTQARLLRSKVLVVGAGGLGAPVLLYLAAAGVGHLVVVDGDTVELSNLHRQVIHGEHSIGMPKAESAARAVRALNGRTSSGSSWGDVQVSAVCERFTEQNAMRLAEGCDLLIDASDNVATRYLVNDVAVVLGIPLVSGSALRMEGQVSVFHLHDEGPCYRCLYPTPPPPAAVTNCSDGGVLGAITGVIGSVQALEAIKILAGLVAPASAQMQAPLSATSSNFDPVSAAASMSTLNTRLLLLDGCSSSFRTMKLRGRNPNCAACGTNPTITRDTLEKQALDYQLFCGSANNDLASSRLPVHTGTVPTASVKQLHAALHPLGAGGSRAAAAADAAVGAAVVAAASTAVAASAASSPSSLPLPAPLPPLLLDVREPVQFRICALPGAINVPLRVLKQQIPAWLMQHLQPATSSSSLPLVAQSITPHPLSATVSASSSSSPSETPQQQPAQSVTIALPRDIFVMCRRGVDSVTAARLLLAHVQQQAQMIASADGAQQQQQAASASVVQLRHVSGGLQAWHDQVDASFPLY